MKSFSILLKPFFAIVIIAILLGILFSALFLSPVSSQAAAPKLATERSDVQSPLKFQKVVLVLMDGLRSDSLVSCEHPLVDELMSHSLYTLKGVTVLPSITLSAHFSLFHSVTPQRHGILSNTYVPPANPVKGLFEVLRAEGKTSAMFYSWEELRDLARPDSLTYSFYFSGNYLGYEKTNSFCVASFLDFLATHGQPDFTFLYLGWPDSAGHSSGWMTPEYFRAVRGSLDLLKSVLEVLPDDTLVIFTADHGGHDNSHGSDLPEDMTIPVFLYNRRLDSAELPAARIIDLAPTAAAVLGVEVDSDWEGTNLLR